MGNGNNNSISGPSAIVAVAIVALLGAVLVASILKYNTVDDALKYAGSLSALLGVITGAFVSYFFSRGAVNAATQTADQAIETATRAAQTIEKMSADNLTAVRQVADTASQAMMTLTNSVAESTESSLAATKQLVETAVAGSGEARVGNAAFRALVATLDTNAVEQLKTQNALIRRALEGGA